MHHWGFFPPIFFLFFIVFMGFFITNMVIWRRRWGCSRGFQQEDRAAIHILEKRLASGEIDVQAYKTLKDVLEGK